MGKQALDQKNQKIFLLGFISLFIVIVYYSSSQYNNYKENCKTWDKRKTKVRQELKQNGSESIKNVMKNNIAFEGSIIKYTRYCCSSTACVHIKVEKEIGIEQTLKTKFFFYDKVDSVLKIMLPNSYSEIYDECKVNSNVVKKLGSDELCIYNQDYKEWRCFLLP